jgi:hypothetical protein
MKGIRYVGAPGAPISDKQARLLGTDLDTIAQSLDREIRSLNKHEVYEWVKAHKSSALGRYVFRKDQSEAAEKYYLDLCGRVLRSIHVVVVHVQGSGKSAIPKKSVRVWQTSDMVPERNERPQRAQVVRADLLRSDPMMVSAIARKIREVDGSIRGLEQLLLGYRPLPDITKLAKDLRAVMSRYLDSVKEEAAE